MAAQRIPFIFMAFVPLVMFGLRNPVDAQLEENFYGFSCPFVEPIVRQAVAIKMAQTLTTVPGTLRLFFHDCFVEGCDASIMIASRNGDAEKDSDINLSLAGDGFDTVIKAKRAVEAVCPGIVSCADVLAIAARDVVVLSGGPSFKVELGRRDGLISKASRVAGKLPESTFKLDQLNALFASHNLTQLDMIALSVAHTVGSSHCKAFSSRIHSTPIDPTLNPSYAQQLLAACPKNNAPANTVVDMDPQTPRRFDNLYYQDLVQRKGLFTSDQDLFENENSKGTVLEFANDAREFDRAFAAAMRKLGRLGVKVEVEGEIRKDCAAFNA